MDFKGVFFNPKNYTLTNKKLGKGAFGTVYVIKKNSDNSQYAAKIIKSNDDDDDGNEQMQIMRESIILFQLNHPSILKFLGINFRSLKDDHSKYQPTIITEYMSHGSLKDILNQERNGLADFNWSPTKKYICLIGISDAMRYLHKLGILHRDLKPENILIDDDFYPKISDFGLSKCFPNSLSNSMKLSMTGQVGTALYMPPEMINGEECGAGVDVYAFAIIAYEVITGKEPYYELSKTLSTYKFWHSILNGTRPSFENADVPEKTQILLNKCWSSDVSERPTFDKIFELLSTDFSYSAESVDEAEVLDYLDKIKDNEEIGDTKKGDLMRKCAGMFKEKLFQLNDLIKYLHFACEIGDIEIVKFILLNGSIDVNEKAILIYFI